MGFGGAGSKDEEDRASPQSRAVRRYKNGDWTAACFDNWPGLIWFGSSTRPDHLRSDWSG
jgi:hypothetical protein